MPRHLLRAAFLALSLVTGSAQASVFMPGDLSQQLEQADSIKTSRHNDFVEELKDLDNHINEMTQQERSYLHYLEAWQVAFSGKYGEATPLLDEIATQSSDATLRLRANATLINILGISHHYEDAFRHLNQLADELPNVKDRVARFQGLGEAAQLLIGSGQYDQAVNYADQMLQEIPAGESTCKARFFKLHAQFHGGQPQPVDPPFQEGVDACMASHEPLVADALRVDIAATLIAHDHAKQAIDLLQSRYPDVQAYHYPVLLARYNTLLARAYFAVADVAQTEQFANAAIAGSIKNEYTEELSTAYSLLYQLALKRGDIQAALNFHEKYMEADKGYLNDITARTLAYQIVNQQLKARKLEVDALSKRNQILQLERQLDVKAVETSRLYIILLITVLASIALLLYRIKRSQLRFKRLAQLDGLTGIFNRQHFVEAAAIALRQAERARRHTCLILIDLDHFKQINDTYGHAAGDRVLQSAVAACRRHLRPGDLFGRLGGEEFGILLSECATANAFDLAEQLRQAVLSLRAEDDNPRTSISASFGISCSERVGHALQNLLVDADHALYRAKHSGRNRVESGDTIVRPEPVRPSHPGPMPEPPPTAIPEPVG
ncbi:GGDEF domain-containing protein [Dyella sp.]|uniref:GGDEF domain-containing protein n=1 Tax=Dyella sp. TaxID=1869338 RepID=UPI002ED3ED49